MALRPTRLLLFRNFRPELIRRYGSNDSDCQVEKKGLVIGVYYDADNKEHKFTAAGQKINAQSSGKLENLIKEAKPLTKGKSAVFQFLDPDFDHVVVVGIGKEDAAFNTVENLDEFREDIRVAAAVGTKRLTWKGVDHIYIESFGNAEAAAEGSILAAWLYQDNKNKDNRLTIPKIYPFSEDDKDGWQKGVIKADAQNLARRLSDAPSNLMTPAMFAQAAVEALCPCGVSVEVRDRDWAESKKMSAFMSVAKGSCEPPVILELGYCGGAHDDKPIAFVGKGVTFDTGGLCLKQCKGMEEFRADMAAAAVIVATMRAAASLSLPLNIQAVLPLCENMISGMALKPGDIVQGMNGKSIRIDSTENEGRLVIADGLVYAYHTFKPRILADIATLTQGMIQSLGDSASGVFTNSEEIWKGLSKAGSYTGDRVWRMPLWKHFTHKVTNIGSADMTNVGVGPGGGACRAAAFLKEFVPCGDWLHMDIANVGMVAKSPDFHYLKQGRMTGRPTRTLIQFLYQLSCEPDKKNK